MEAEVEPVPNKDLPVIEVIKRRNILDPDSPAGEAAHKWDCRIDGHMLNEFYRYYDNALVRVSCEFCEKSGSVEGW